METTARDAWARDFHIVLLEDCMASSDISLHEASLRSVGLLGSVLSSPEGIDVDAFNENEMEKLRHRSVDELLDNLNNVRKTLIDWVGELGELELDRVGRHPVLGASTVETVIFSRYAHQLLHMREIAPTLRKSLM